MLHLRLCQRNLIARQHRKCDMPCRTLQLCRLNKNWPISVNRLFATKLHRIKRCSSEKELRDCWEIVRHAMSHILSRDRPKVARQNRAIKLPVWHRSNSSRRRICNVTHQGAARDGGPVVLRPVRTTPWLLRQRRRIRCEPSSTNPSFAFSELMTRLPLHTYFSFPQCARAVICLQEMGVVRISAFCCKMNWIIEYVVFGTVYFMLHSWTCAWYVMWRIWHTIIHLTTVLSQRQWLICLSINLSSLSNLSLILTRWLLIRSP